MAAQDKAAQGKPDKARQAEPAVMPKARRGAPPPDGTESPALSLMARPGDGGIGARQVAILAADGVAGASIAAVRAALLEAGAVPTVIGPQLGPVATSDGAECLAEGSFENSPAGLFDAVVLPDGEAGVALLAGLCQAREFVVNLYRHGKTILAIGASETLLGMADISTSLASGEPDPGVIVGHGSRIDPDLREFIAAIGRHRHAAREVRPPAV